MASKAKTTIPRKGHLHDRFSGDGAGDCDRRPVVDAATVAPCRAADAASPQCQRRRLPDASRRDRCRSGDGYARRRIRSEEHTSELQSLMRISYAVFRFEKKK